MADAGASVDAQAIAANLARARERVDSALARAGRAPGSARLVAVSKTKPVWMLEAALNAGQIDFGENYAQEAAQKIDALSARGARVHFIGALQTNKAKLIVGRAALVHSVDRLRLAREISALAERAGVRQDVLIQLRVGGEATKSGATAEDALAIAREARALPGLRLRGVMSLPPLSDDEAVSRAYFAQTRASFERVRDEARSDGFDELSMGTSGDFEAAILEGATLVRVGAAIFGEREPK